jgi:hypothetical protein
MGPRRNLEADILDALSIAAIVFLGEFGMLRDQEKLVQRLREAARAGSSQLATIVEWSPKYVSGNGQRLWDGTDIPGQPYSVQDGVLVAKRVLDAVHGMPPSRVGLGSTAATSALHTAVVGSRNATKALYDAIVAISNAKPVAQLNQYIATDSAGNQIADIGQLAAALIGTVDAIKAALPAFVTYPKSDPKIGVLEIAASATLRKELADQRDAAAKLSAEMAESKVRAEKTEAELTQLKAAGEAKKNETEAKLLEMVNGTEAARTQVQEILDSLSEFKDTAQAQRAEIESLRDSARDISGNLNAFDGTLKSIRTELEEIRGSAESRYKDQEQYVAHVEELIAKAKAMLGAATITGLAKAFDDERKDLDKRMRGAMIGFALGIGMILVVTGMLALYVFRIEIGQEVPGVSDTEAAVTLTGFLSRSIILLGPVWLALFSARRYRNLFDLRQQYSHKYNMAFSVNGFQNQAPDYSQQIAYWVFQTVGANPVGAKESKGGMDEHPMEGIKDLLSSIVSRLPLPMKAD